MGEPSSWLSLPAWLQSLGPLVIQGLGVLAILLGVMLWLMGKRLARPACAGVWVVIGMLLAGGVCHLLGDGGLLPVWLIAGGIVSGALGWLVYRLCLAMVLCVVLAVCVPAAVHFLHDAMPRPDLADDTQELVQAVQEEARQTQEQLARDDSKLTASQAIDAIGRVAAKPWQKLQDHWGELPTQARLILLASTAIGGLGGLILGLVFPGLASAVGSSLLGTLCMAGGSIVIFTQYNPALVEAIDRQTPGFLLILGLITALGVGIQWTLQRRRTDN